MIMKTILFTILMPPFLSTALCLTSVNGDTIPSKTSRVSQRLMGKTVVLIGVTHGGFLRAV